MGDKVTKPVCIGRDEWYCNWYRCPSCKEEWIAREFKYCPCCGKEINWNGVGEE